MKNKLTKMLSLVIVMIMIATFVGTVPVFAEDDVAHVVKATEETVIEAEEYSLVKSKSMAGDYRAYNSGGRYPNIGAQVVSSTAQFHYYVNVEKAGRYELCIYTYPAGRQVWRVLVDDVLVDQPDFSTADSAITKHFMTNLELTKGYHYISLVPVIRETASSLFFYYMTLKPISSGEDFAKDSGSFKETHIPAVIQAEDFDLGAGGSYSFEVNQSDYRADSKMKIMKASDGDYDLRLRKDEFAKYTFSSNVSDIYTISMEAKGEGHVTLLLDGEELPVSGRIKDEVNYEEVKLSTAYIDAGEHTLQVSTDADEHIDIDYIRIYSGKDIADTTVKIEENEAGTLNNVYKTFYVSTIGNDKTGDGSKANPFASIGRAKEEVAKVNDDMTGDIVVYVQPGEYKLEETEVFTPEYGGKNGYNVIFKGTDILNPPMISGGQRVTGWTKGENGIWSAPLSADIEYVRNLYVNEFPAIRARSTYKYQMTQYYDDPATTDTTLDGFKFRRLNFPAEGELSRVQDMELVWNWQWETIRTPITGIIWEDEEVIIKLYEGSIDKDSTTVKDGEWAYLENAKELLNEPGEFYWDAGEERIYYYPYAEEDMSTAVTYVGDTEKLIKVQGNSADEKVENLVFDNFKIFYGAWNFISKYGFKNGQSDGLGIMSYIPGVWANQVAGQIEVDYADGFVLRNCEIACQGSIAIDMEDGVTNSKIEGNLIRDVSGTGIKVGDINHHKSTEKANQCRKIDITNNYITRIGGEIFGNVAISVIFEKDINVLHNSIKNVPYSGMSIGWGWNHDIQYDVGGYNVSYNSVEDVMETNSDGGGIYTLGKLGGTVISNNYMRGYYRSSTGGILYHDAGSGNVEDFNNVLLDATYVLHVCAERMYPRNIYFHDNYTNCPDNDGRKANNYPSAAERQLRIEEPVMVDKDNLPEEAQAIKDAAGVEPQYKRLQAKGQIPEWREDRHYGARMDGFKSQLKEEPGVIVEAEDFIIEGGEGVAYHKQLKYDKPNNYRTDVRTHELLKFSDLGSYVIGTNTSGEWQRYKLVIPVDGEYYVSVRGSIYWYEEPANVAKLSLNGEDLDMEFMMPHGEEGGKWKDVTAPDTIFLKAGEYDLKMTFASSFYFDRIRFLHTDENVEIPKFYGNEPHYDESKFVTYENYKSAREKQRIKDEEKAKNK